MSPTGSGAGVITDLNQTLAWANPAGSYVSSAYLFSQNRISVTNGQGETALHFQRGNITFRPAAFKDTQANGVDWVDTRSGVSMSTSTANLGINPNPRCGSGELVALEDASTNLSYREIGIGFNDQATRKFNNAIWFWNN